jgi:FMN hydrolase / 5-amino-6-(5-phospho-D-ribitylamino)uracil phosphatase
MLDMRRIRAITLDLDDTLWPVWPVMARAEKALSDWLAAHAPQTAALMTQPDQRLALRQQVQRERPDISLDLGTLRREVIRLALQLHAEDTALVEPAYDVFIAERMRVDLFDEVRPALAWMAARFPLVAISNGNADVHRVGIGEYFRAALSAQDFGVGKPDPRIFHAAAAAAGVPAHDALHVGDDAEMDVLGGLKAGMQTVWVNRVKHEWVHEAQPHVRVSDLRQLCALLQC